VAVSASSAPVILFPREHGAWGMLIVSFVSGAILAGPPSWAIIPAALTVLLLFLAREPLVVLGRQALVWKETHSETATARRLLVIYTAALALSGASLLTAMPLAYAFGIGVPMALLMALSVLMTVRNRQRAVWLQVLIAGGLNASCLVAWLATHPQLTEKPLWLWALATAQSLSAILLVHARLDAKLSTRRDRPANPNPAALAVHLALLVAAATLTAFGNWKPAVPLALCGAWHTAEWNALRRPESLNTPLKKVGWRALSLSIAYSILVLAALW
jgi:hypothetical protein